MQTVARLLEQLHQAGKGIERQIQALQGHPHVFLRREMRVCWYTIRLQEMLETGVTGNNGLSRISV
jgi:hypothetical protein